MPRVLQRVLPRMPDEAPAGYVAFVARHLEPLRRDAARVVGDEEDADRLYPDVLADVAARWGWLELMRTRLGRVGAAETYLHQAFVRRSERWQADRFEVMIDGDEGRPPVDILVLRPGQRLPYLPVTPEAPEAEPGSQPPVSRPVGSNAAVRLAPFLRPATPPRVGPLAEAAIAWWHAYEAYRRRLVIAAVVVLFLLIAAALRFQHSPGTGDW
jgi:hypothetical protein